MVFCIFVLIMLSMCYTRTHILTYLGYDYKTGINSNELQILMNEKKTPMLISANAVFPIKFLILLNKFIILHRNLFKL